MPLSRRQIYRRRRGVVFGGLALVLAVGFYLPTTLLAPLHAVSASVVHVPAPTTKAADIVWPTYGASAIGAVGYDGVLASSGAKTPLPMASVSKIITALVVLEAKPLALDQPGPEITFTSADVALYSHYQKLNGSLEPVRAGMRLTELQVLQLVLIPSANNYATSLATWAFGSQDAFVRVAKKWIAGHGMSSTTMVEPTGIDPANTSTSADLVLLGKLAVADPVVSKIVATKKVSIPDIGVVENTNKLLGLDGVTGLKTGTLDTAGANLLFSADYTVGDTTVRLIGVVLGGKNHDILDKDIQIALAGVKAGFQPVTLAKKGTVYGWYETPWGERSTLVAAKDSTYLVWSDTPISSVVTAKDVTLAPAGDEVGTLHVTVGAKKVDVPLELSSSITDPGAGWRLAHPSDLL